MNVILFVYFHFAGGFSMGGALAMHTAFRWDRNLAGVFAFSSFLNDKSIVFDDLRNSPRDKCEYNPGLK